MKDFRACLTDDGGILDAVTGNRKPSVGVVGSGLKLRGTCPVTQRPHLPTQPTLRATAGFAGQLCQAHASLWHTLPTRKLEAKEGISGFPDWNPVLLMPGRYRNIGTKWATPCAEGTACCLKVLLALAEDLGSVALTHSSSRDEFLLDSMHIPTRIHRIKIKIKVLNELASADLTLLIQNPPGSM